MATPPPGLAPTPPGTASIRIKKGRSDTSNPVFWVRCGNKITGKPKRRHFEYGGYLVCLPARMGDDEGLYHPIEEFSPLEIFKPGMGRDRDMSVEAQEDLKRLRTFFDSHKGIVQSGVKGEPTRGPQVKPSSLVDRPNLCDLEVLEDSDISFQVRQRYYNDKIYTYIGQILVAVNPYANLKFVEGPFKNMSIIHQDAIHSYHETVNDNFQGLPPHIYAVGARAFDKCRSESTNQAVIISGESGSGKTVTTKLVLKFLQIVSSRYHNNKALNNETLKAPRRNSTASLVSDISVGTGEGGMSIENRIEFTNPILESFESEELKTQPRPQLRLASRAHGGSGIRGEAQYVAGGWDDADMFNKVCLGLKGIGMWHEKESIFSIIACVLHLGNIEFDGDKDKSYVSEKSIKVVEHCAKLLKTDVKQLTSSLTKTILVIRGEEAIKQQGKKNSERSRDALAKHIYRSMFSWLVEKLSKRLHDPGDESKYKNVGVLDIFGFEDFVDENYFEQLCINYANEQLQGNFNKHIFKEELALYKSEHLPKSVLEQLEMRCPSNEKTLDLLAQMVKVLDEGSNMNPMPKVREKFISRNFEKYYGMENKGNTPRGSRGIRMAKSWSATGDDILGETNSCCFDLTSYQDHFAIYHYAGRIEYKYKGMLERNNDKLLPALRKAASESKSDFVKSLFPQAQKKSSKKGSIMKHFQRSLGELMHKLNAADPHYVRCIKPNVHKVPKMFQTSKVLEQMNCAGLFQAVKIRKAGFPNRVSLDKFVKNFGPVIPDHMRKERMSECSNVRERAEAVIELMARLGAANNETKGEGMNVFAGRRHVLMRTIYWNKIHHFRRETMKAQFVECIESRDIKRLESVVRRAEELELHFTEAVTARRLLKFLLLEQEANKERLPSMMKLTDPDDLDKNKNDLLGQFNVLITAISSTLKVKNIMQYLQTKEAKVLKENFEKLRERAREIEKVRDIKNSLSSLTNPEGATVSLGSIGPLKEAIAEAKGLPKDLLEAITNLVKDAKDMLSYLERAQNLLHNIEQ
ncbi:hypothetical protein AAMO2058_001527400, partial [Amorphochlora amoebiformis]